MIVNFFFNFFFSLFCDGLAGAAGETISKGTDCGQRSAKCNFLKVQKRNIESGLEGLAIFFML